MVADAIEAFPAVFADKIFILKKIKAIITVAKTSKKPSTQRCTNHHLQ